MPHTRPGWNTNKAALWDSWYKIVSGAEKSFSGNTLNYVVPSYYLPLEVNNNKTTYYDSMKDRNLIIVTTSSSIQDIKNSILPYLNNDDGSAKRGLGLLFQNTTSGDCLGQCNTEAITQLKELDTELKGYKNYMGMDVLDSSALIMYLAHMSNSQYFPPIRTVYFNYYNFDNEELYNAAVKLAQKLNTSISIDISDMNEDTPSCESFNEMKHGLMDKGIDVKVVLNRSYWIDDALAYFNFLFVSSQCLATFN